MRVIAIYPFKNSSVACFNNGSCKTILHEEKFTNIKNYEGFPYKSLDFLNKLHHFNEYDYFTFPLLEKSNKQFTKNGWITLLKKQYKVQKNNIYFYNYHLAYAAAVIYFYNMNNANEDILVFIAGNYKNNYFAKIYKYQFADRKFVCIAKSPFSVSTLFTEAALFLGMKAHEHEYKVMGLAAYSNDKKNYMKIYNKLANNIYLNETKLSFSSKFDLNNARFFFEKEFKNEKPEIFASGLQYFLEDLVIKWIKATIGKTGITTIACAGEMFMNVKLNKKIQEIQDIKKVYFMPSAGAESLVFGCGSIPFFNKKLPTISDQLMYKGLSYSNSKIKKFLTQKKYAELFKIKYFRNIEYLTAKLLKNSEIVARFSGSGEWGARSLCNRCILANASNLDTIRILNEMIKMRESWMPFAPTFLSKWAGKYIKNWGVIKSKVAASSKYMITAFDSTELAREHLKAAIHPKDMTLRPQIVDKSDNIKLYKLLKYYEKMTGMGGFLNTSLNIHGYPLSWTLEQAFFTFENSSLKYLVLENYLVCK